MFQKTHITPVLALMRWPRLAQAGVPVKGVVFNDLDTSRQRYGGYGYKYSRYRYTNYQYAKSGSQ